MEPTLPDKAFSMGVRPAACSTGDVCMALDYLEDPAVHGITTQVCRAATLLHHLSCYSPLLQMMMSQSNPSEARPACTS